MWFNDQVNSGQVLFYGQNNKIKRNRSLYSEWTQSKNSCTPIKSLSFTWSSTVSLLILSDQWPAMYTTVFTGHTWQLPPPTTCVMSNDSPGFVHLYLLNNPKSDGDFYRKTSSPVYSIASVWPAVWPGSMLLSILCSSSHPCKWKWTGPNWKKDKSITQIQQC